MKNTTTDIYQVNDSFFHKIFDSPENARDFLEFLEYVSQTQEINRDQLKEMLDESKIDGGEIMPTLAQQMKEEFREEFLGEFKEEFKQALAQQMKEEFREEFLETMGPQLKDEGKKEGKKEGKEEGKKEGMEEKAIETAKKMLKKGFETDIIIELTGLNKEEVENLASISQ